MATAMANYASVPEWVDATNGRSVACDHFGHMIALAGASEGVTTATVGITALRAHRAIAFVQMLRAETQSPKGKDLCVLPRLESCGGTCALGRMSVPL